MELRQITPRYFVSPQISAEDVPAIVEAGITTVICNRPDAEIPPSHCADAIREAVEAAGLKFVINPLTHQTMTPDRLSLQRDTLEGCDGVVLAYCASGTRSTVAWALSHAKDTDPDALLQAAAEGGYDLGGLRPTLHALSDRG